MLELQAGTRVYYQVGAGLQVACGCWPLGAGLWVLPVLRRLPLRSLRSLGGAGKAARHASPARPAARGLPTARQASIIRESKTEIRVLFPGGWPWRASCCDGGGCFLLVPEA